MYFDDATTRKLIRSLYRRQTMIALLLIVLAFGTLFLFWLNLANFESNAETVNLAGRQRMLSQRITLYANRFLVEADPEQKLVFRRLVDKYVGEFQIGHDSLRQKATDPDGAADSAFQNLYFGSGRLDETSRLFIEFARHVITEELTSNEQRELSRDRIQRMADMTLIRPLDDATTLFQKKAERQSRTLWQVMLASGVLIISAVLFGTLSVFRPMIGKVRADLAARDRAAAALRASKERFRNFSAASSDWLWETDGEHRLTWLEGARESGLPFSIDEVMGKTRHELAAAEDLSGEANWRRHQADLDAHRPFRDFEYPIRVVDGSSRWISVNGQPFFNVNGTFLGYRGTGRDVHDKKETEATLQQLFLAIEQSPVSVTITDSDANITYVNTHFCTLTGYSAKEVIGQNVRLLKSGEHPARLYSDLWQALRSGRTWRGEICNRKKSGELYWEQASISPVHDADGKTTHYVAVNEDITKRRLAERALSESEAMKRSIVAAAMDAIVTIDAQGNTIDFNPAAERIFGLRHDELLGKPIADFIIPERYRDAHREGLRRCATGGGGGGMLGRRVEFPAIDVCGREFPIEISVIRPPGMNVYVAYIRDLTEQKKADESLRHTQKLQAMGQLTGGIAHDFNNLLGIIQGNLELLKRAFPNNEPGSKRVDIALRTTQRGADLTRRLLMFARQDSGDVQATPANLNDLLEGMLDVLRRTLTRKIEIVPKFSADLWTVAINAGEFEDCIVNLAINARDAMPGGGRLTLRTENVRLQEAIEHIGPDVPLGDYVLVSVSDNGCGIPKELVGRIFEPFFTTKERGKGTGLGLAMVYGAIRRAGGHANVYSEPGVGTSFRIYLPKTDPGPALTPDTGTGTGSADGMRPGNSTVLVVDDEPMLLDVAECLLEEIGYRVILANSGAEALALIETHPDIDVVVSDIIMPGEIDGIELAKRILANGNRPGIVLASGYSEYDDRHITDEALRTIVRNIVTKPYSKRQLAAQIERVLAESTISS